MNSIFFHKMILPRAVFIIASLFSLAACTNTANPQREYQTLGYGSIIAKTMAKPISVEQFSGTGITALHAYLPVGSQVDVINPVTHQHISARVIGRTPKNQQNKLLLSPDAAKVLNLDWYPNTKMLMKVSRKTNISTWPSRAQKTVSQYIPTRKGVKNLLASIPRVASTKTNKGRKSHASKVQHGKASYYARRFHGRKTASGERFNMNAMTCAHRSLPFGTNVKITNKSNGRSVILRVNDRGPYSKGRIVDVSFAAAKKLGMIKRGTALVKLEVLN